ncbi:MAG: hypothetical protein KGY54_10765 [Oleiphilaceae bacterium]|nr:hypothetical protein [Oleiphilaceae bacterium]
MNNTTIRLAGTPDFLCSAWQRLNRTTREAGKQTNAGNRRKPSPVADALWKPPAAD